MPYRSSLHGTSDGRTGLPPTPGARGGQELSSGGGGASTVSGRPAIFLDRDGTLNEPVGFVNHISLFRLFPWSVEAIRLINHQGYLAVVVTNQSGVAPPPPASGLRLESDTRGGRRACHRG